jgi:hypothetical protein
MRQVYPSGAKGVPDTLTTGESSQVFRAGKTGRVLVYMADGFGGATAQLQWKPNESGTFVDYVIDVNGTAVDYQWTGTNATSDLNLRGIVAAEQIFKVVISGGSGTAIPLWIGGAAVIDKDS